MPIVTLTTDFGDRDYYVGAMKGVLLGIAPTAQLVDISHHIPPQDILTGAFILRHAAREFPRATVHLAIIDPCAGTQRRALAFEADDQIWVGPDNGLFSFIFDRVDGNVHQIDREDLCAANPSHTFNGRDLLAPIAAHLCRGLDVAEIGPAISDPIRLSETTPCKTTERIQGQIIHIDRFGNLVSNISAADIAPWGRNLHIRLDTHLLSGLEKTYSDVALNAPLALIGDTDLVEISVNGGSAAQYFGLGRRTSIIIEKPS